MKPFPHSLQILGLRYRWEVLGFVAIVILSGIAPSTPLAPGWIGTFAILETLGLFWLTLRVLLADDGFKTHGGWQARPVRPGQLLAAQLIFLALIIALPLTMHAFLIHSRYQPTPEQWTQFLSGGLRRAAFAWLAFAVSIKLFAFLILRQLEGRARVAAWSVLVIVLVPTTLAILPNNVLASRGGNGGSGDPPTRLSASIQHQLTHVTEFIGEWSQPAPPTVPQAKRFLTVPLDGSPQSVVPGLRITQTRASSKAPHTKVQVSFEALDTGAFATLREIDDPILLYANGMAATCLNHMHYNYSAGSSYLPIHGLKLHATFFSPAALPEYQNVDASSFEPTHLLFFVEDPAAPELPAPLDQKSADHYAPAPPVVIPLPDHDDFDLAIRQLVDSLAGPDEGEVEHLITAEQLPPAAINSVLAYRPWPDRAWHELIFPFLKENVTEKDKPILLERLALDPRLTELFIEKGWAADAIPVLRRRAGKGLDLDAPSLRLLAEQADLDLGGTLARLAIRLPKGIDTLAPSLREATDFDWPAFVTNGWRTRKYGVSSYANEGWFYALWAAELGDRSALQHLAEEAAAGKTWEREQLAKLIPTAPAELIPFLRENLQRLRYEASDSSWRLP